MPLNKHSGIDEKTKAILRIIDEDADSFSQRAEMYYKKRPELISMVEDLYRGHRSLAERFDQVKSDTGFRVNSPWSSPLPFKHQQEKLVMTFNDKSYDSYSESYDPLESGESEVDDPEQEEEDQNGEEKEEEEVSSEVVINNEVMNLRKEIERLKEENKIQKEQLREKDEEKREVIRQLSQAMDVLKEENVKLRNFIIAKESSPKKWSPPSEFDKLKGMFLGKLFNGSPKSKA
ncbi:hypothetical protein U1Q18_034224 [Sarracenia purpurea var. burkii]